MSKLGLQAKSTGVDTVISQLDKLTKAEQKIVMEGSAVGKTMGKSSRSGISGLTKMASAAKMVVGGMVGIGSAAGLVAAVVGRVRADFEKIRELQDKAKESQRSFGDEVGEFISNNPQLNRKQVQNWVNVSQTEGQILGEGGPQKVMRAITQVRSGTPGATEAMQKEAVHRAVMQARVAPETDIGAYATGIVKTQQVLASQGKNVNATEAHNLVGMMGARAGGSISDLVGRVGKLGGGAIGGETPMEDVLSTFGFFTGELADQTGEQTTTMVLNMLTKAKTRNLKIGGKAVAKKDGSGLDIILDLLDRIDKGEFGDATTARADLGKQLMKGAMGPTALAVLAKNRDRFGETRKMVGSTLSGGGEDFAAAQLTTKEQVLGAVQTGQEKTRKAKGELEVLRQIGPEGEWSRMRERMGVFRESVGQTGEWDIGKDYREWSGMHRGVSPVEWEKAEKTRILRAEALKMSPELSSAKTRSENSGVLGAELGGGGAGIGAGDGGDWTAAQKEMAGLDSVPEWARYIIDKGGVSADKGLSREEAFVLMQAGAKTEEVTALAKVGEKGDQAALAKALAELVEEMRKRAPEKDAAEVIESAVQRGKDSAPSAGKDVDSA